MREVLLLDVAAVVLLVGAAARERVHRRREMTEWLARRRAATSPRAGSGGAGRAAEADQTRAIDADFGPIPKRDLVFVLENALRSSNIVLLSDNPGYRLIPAGDATGSGRISAG